jgi:4-amino-4-deoxy-L-arabinose transferase-like glycosyltransferase
VSAPTEPRPRWFLPGLAAITAAGFVWRVGYTLATKRHDTNLFDEGDAFFYRAVAENLARGEWFTVPFNGAPAADHPPLTVLVSTPAAWLFEGSVLAGRLTMTLVGTVAIVAIALLGRAVAGPVAGLVAAALAAVNPNFWMNDAVIMSEAISTVLIALLMLAGVALARSPTVSRAAVAGALCGLTVLARAEIGLFLPLMILPIVVTAHGLDARQRLGRLTVAALAAVAVVAPWTVSNLLRFDEPVLISTNDGTTLLGANCPDTYDTAKIGSWSLDCVLDLSSGEGDPSTQAGEQRKLAFEYIGDHAGRLPLVVVAREGRTFGYWRPDQMVYANQGEGRPRWASWAGLAGFWVLVPFAVAGALRLRRSGTTLAPFAAALATVVAVSALFYGIPRFRLPLDVAVTVLAAVAIAGLISSRRRDEATAGAAAASAPTT